LQEKGRNRSKPRVGHLNATEYRGRDAGDALAPVSTDAECRGRAHDEGEAEPTEGGGVALLVGSPELGEVAAEEPAQRIGSPGTVVGPGAWLGRRSVHSGHMKKNAGMDTSA